MGTNGAVPVPFFAKVILFLRGHRDNIKAEFPTTYRGTVAGHSVGRTAHDPTVNVV
jgi:hypothetical protein